MARIVSTGTLIPKKKPKVAAPVVQQKIPAASATKTTGPAPATQAISDGSKPAAAAPPTGGHAAVQGTVNIKPNTTETNIIPAAPKQETVPAAPAAQTPPPAAATPPPGNLTVVGESPAEKAAKTQQQAMMDQLLPNPNNVAVTNPAPKLNVPDDNNTTRSVTAQNPNMPDMSKVTDTATPGVQFKPGDMPDMSQVMNSEAKTVQEKTGNDYLSGVEESPLYKFQREEGLKALEARMAAKGLTGSGFEGALEAKFLNELGGKEAERQSNVAQQEAERNLRAQIQNSTMSGQDKDRLLAALKTQGDWQTTANQQDLEAQIQNSTLAAGDKDRLLKALQTEGDWSQDSADRSLTADTESARLEAGDKDRALKQALGSSDLEQRNADRDLAIQGLRQNGQNALADRLQSILTNESSREERAGNEQWDRVYQMLSLAAGQSPTQQGYDAAKAGSGMTIDQAKALADSLKQQYQRVSSGGGGGGGASTPPFIGPAPTQPNNLNSSLLSLLGGANQSQGNLDLVSKFLTGLFQ